MTATETTHLLALDEDWRPLERLNGHGEWRDILAQILRLDSRWLVLEQRRAHDPVPAPRWEDIRLSRALTRRLRPMEMKLADHVIHGQKGRFSFREAGLL